MPLGMEVGLCPGDFVVDGDPAPSPKRGAAPQFLAHVYCGQTAEWIKMPLDTEVGLSQDDIVLDGDWGPSCPSPKGGIDPCPIFSGCLLWSNGWMDQDGMEVGLGPGHIVLHGDPAPLPQKGAEPPIFGPILQRAQCSHCKRCISYRNSVRLSVHPSVTRRYCVKTTARSMVQFAPLDSKICLVL